MDRFRPFAGLMLCAALSTPGLASAQSAPRLALDPADTDHDGRVSDLERANHLASTPAKTMPVRAPRLGRPLVAFDPTPAPPGPMDLARRIVPASDFEVAQAHQFQKAWDKRH